MANKPQPVRPESVRLVRIFVSSPGDVAEERTVLEEVIERINRTDGQAQSVHLVPWKWEKDVVSRIGPRPQDVVDAQTPPYDIYLGIMAARFGTPTDAWGSGTEQEFRDALACWQKRGRPWILFFFNDQPPTQRTTKEIQQYLQVRQFRDELETLGIAGSYTGVRGNATGFFEKVDEHLRRLLHDHFLPARSPERAAGAAKRAEPSSGKKPTFPSAYREWLLGQCGDIELLGLQLKHGQAARLNQVYVPLATPAREEGRPRPESEPGASEGERPKPQLLLDLLDKDSLYVSGAPGAGKSTFCRWVTWLACAGTLPPQQVEAPAEYAESFPESLRDRLPVLLRLREFWEYLPRTVGGRELSQEQLEQALAGWWHKKKPAGVEWPDLPAHLRQGSALLVVDGVDEVPLTHGEGRQAWHPRALLLAGLAAAVPGWVKRGNRLLLTSRPYGVSETEGRKLAVRHAAIDDLPGPGQELLVRRWFHILADNPAAGAATAGDMLDHLRGRAELEPLVANPMLLTAMCIIYHQGKRLPQDKYDLYARIVDNVLYNRYPNDPAVIDLVLNRLSVLAHGMHTGAGLGEERATPQAEATYAELDRMLQAYQEQKSWTEPGFKTAVDTREQLLSHTGLLLPRADRRAGFYHLSFQEFLAAQRILDVDGDRLFEVFGARGAAGEWRNTLSFVFASQLGKCTSPERSIRLLGRLIETLPPSRERAQAGWLGLAVVVADCLQILLGRKIRLQGELEEKFRQTCLSAIEGEAPVRERFLLGQALGQLGDPRVVPDLRDRAAYVEIKAGDYLVGDERRSLRLKKSFLLARHPVTNSQYALFMQEKGYENPAWWSEGGRRWLSEEGEREPVLWRNAKWNGPNQPVVGVSFWVAEAFAAWAGGRLPGEYEWEAAARGPEGFKYPWGDEWTDGICNSNEAGLGVTSPVGLFMRSRSKAFGLEDMAGNVWEWCADVYELGGEDSRRVVRGSSWGNEAWFCRPAFRRGFEAGDRGSILGFRVVCVSP